MQLNNWLLPLVVVGVVGTALYLCVKNNNMDVVNNLATMIVGYYFGTKARDTLSDIVSK